MHETGACTNNEGGRTTGRVTNLDQVHATGPQDHTTTCHMPQSSCQPGPQLVWSTQHGKYFMRL